MLKDSWILSLEPMFQKNLGLVPCWQLLKNSQWVKSTSRISTNDFTFSFFVHVLFVSGKVWGSLLCYSSAPSKICSDCCAGNWDPWRSDNWWLMQGMRSFFKRLGWADKVSLFYLFCFLSVHYMHQCMSFIVLVVRQHLNLKHF